MKKLLVVAVAVLVSASAFASKMMVELDGCVDGGRCSNLDFHMDSQGESAEDAEDDVSGMDLAFNFNYLFTDNIGAGLTYKSMSNKTGGEVGAVGEDNSTTIGLSGFYNLQGGWADSCWVALHYDMTTLAEPDGGDGASVTDITLEYGHRFALGTAWGLNLNYAPSVGYRMRTYQSDADW